MPLFLLFRMLFACLRLTPVSFEQRFEEIGGLNELIFLLQKGEIVARGARRGWWHASLPTSAFPLPAYSVPNAPPLQARLNTGIESKTKPGVTDHSQRVKSTNFNFLTFLPPLLGSRLLLEIPGVGGNYFKEQFVFRSKLRENPSHRLLK